MPNQVRKEGILTLAVEYFADTEYLFTIPKEAFTPVPKVDSAFMSIKLRQGNPYEKLIDEDLFFKYVKAAFANKRKNIVNNLAMLGFNKGDLREIFEGNNIDPKKRAEAFSIDEFIELIQILEKVGR